MGIVDNYVYFCHRFLKYMKGYIYTPVSFNFLKPKSKQLAAGNSRHTSLPRLGLSQPFIYTKFVSYVWCNPLILGKKSRS